MCLVFDLSPHVIIPAEYALQDLEVLTLLIIKGSLDSWFHHLQELVLQEVINAGAEDAVVRQA